MGKTHRNQLDDNKKKIRQKSKRKPGDIKQGYDKYRYDTQEETESRWANDGISFEKFSRRNSKR